MTRIFLLVLAPLPFIVLAAFIYAMPIFPAILCPECYNFEKHRNNVYIGKQATDAQKKNFEKAYSTARQRLEGVLGPLQSNPIILSSATEQQYASIGGGESKGQAVSSLAIRLSPKGLDPQVMSREICHIELQERLKAGGKGGSAPAWFEKGLAVLLSQDQSYIGAPGSGELSEREVRKLRYPQQWELAAREGKQIHAPAFRIVSLWYEKAGKEGLHELLNRVNKGEPFEKVYNELGDRP